MGDEVTVKRFSWPSWIGGLFLSLVFGCILNVVAGLIAASAHSKVLSPLIGITPGLLFGLLAFFMRNRSRAFAIGLLTGACVVALVGGICGGELSGGIDFK